LILNGTGSLLLAVNAGSNELSSLRAGIPGLQVLSKVPSGGTFPNSVALNGDLVYVLNARGVANIGGFRLDFAGVLTPLPGSSRPLLGGSAAAPHDIRFSTDGSRLLVTEGGTQRIVVIPLDSSGLPENLVPMASAGVTPFGMKFGRAGALVVTEADSASVSSYFLTGNNTLDVKSATVPSTQMATCWIALTGDGKFGFASNTASGTISTYQLSGNGTLTLEQAVTASGLGALIDSAMSNDSRFLYVQDLSGHLKSGQWRSPQNRPIGNDTKFREALTAMEIEYAVGIQSTVSLWRPGQEPLPPKAKKKTGRPSKFRLRSKTHQPANALLIAQQLPAAAWKNITWRAGTKKALRSRFACVNVRPAHHHYERSDPLPEQWLLVEWPKGEPEPTKYWLSTMAPTATLAELIKVAKHRWIIERDYEELKQELGLGHFEGRGWRGFHHHATLCIAAYGFLIAERSRFPPPPAPERYSFPYPRFQIIGGPAVRPQQHNPYSMLHSASRSAKPSSLPCPAVPLVNAFAYNTVVLATRLCRTSHRHHSPRVSGPRDRVQ
jgi:6-phosphogluconolactonase (cycloisomerase 2 family)